MSTLDQKSIDKVRFRVLLHLLRSVLESELKPEPYHIWFPKDQDDVYSIRKGNAPADVDRPKHLRRLKLHVDIQDTPSWLRQCIEPGGFIDQEITRRCQLAGLEGDDATAVRCEVFRRYADTIAEKSYEKAWAVG